MTKSGLYFTDQAKDDAEPRMGEPAVQRSRRMRKRDGRRLGRSAVLAGCRTNIATPGSCRVRLFHGEPHVNLGTFAFPAGCGAATPSQHRAICGVVWHRCDPNAACRPSRPAAGMACPTFCRMAPRMAIGDIILRPEWQRADLSCAQAGTLAEWQDQVARYAVGNSRLALFLSAAFAGALLEIIAEPSVACTCMASRRPANPRRHSSPRRSWAKVQGTETRINGARLATAWKVLPADAAMGAL